MSYIVYILQCADMSYYTGITTNITRRIQQHNGRKQGGAKYTSTRQPVVLAYLQAYPTRRAAAQQEYVIKQLSHAEKRILIDMNYHAFIQNAIQKAPKKRGSYFDPARYNGTHHPYLGITTHIKRDIAKQFKRTFPQITFDELIELLNALNAGNTFEEKTIGPLILAKYPQMIYQIKPNHIEKWLDNLEGWCEIDALCQSTFPPEVFLDNWAVWRRALVRWSKDHMISKRRASLVLLCKSLRQSDDTRFAAMALAHTQRLKQEKNILITKAISWVLREMVKRHKSMVVKYLEDNEGSLPKIAVRETRKKIATGKK